MKFNSTEPIYVQIVNYVSEHIVMGKWNNHEKIPSVRDLAIRLEVNPNTISRAYEFLEQLNVIYNKRGIGFFVAEDGLNVINDYNKKIFKNKDLPKFFLKLTMMKIQLSDLEDDFNKFLSDKNKLDERHQTE